MEVKNIKKLCSMGITLPSIAKKANTTVYKLKKFIKANKIPYNYNRELDPERKSCNVEYFDKITTEKQAYILGFLYADGWITGSGKTVGFSQKVSDIDILEKIHIELQCKSPICIKKSGQAELNIGSKYMVETLKHIGITTDKSYTAKLPKLPIELIPHLIRGLFDGDGYIGRQPTFVSRSKTLIQQVANYIKILTNISINYAVKDNIYIIVLPAKVRNILLPLMYKNASIYLDRKYNIYKTMFEE